MKKTSKPVTVSMKKPTKKQIEFVLSVGTTVQVELDTVTQIIKADLFNRDMKTNQSALTVAFDKVMNTDQAKLKKGEKLSTPEMRTDLKRFIRKQVQTLVKEKTTQQALLGEQVEGEKITVKMVTKPMVENNSTESYPSGRFIDNFNETDLGSYRAVREHKPLKPEETILQALEQFCEKHSLEIDVVITPEVVAHCDEVESQK